MKPRQMDWVESRVDDLAHDGCGIVRWENRVYFVDGVLPGELIRFVPGRKKRGRLAGTLFEICEPSGDRVKPDCEYFGVCGGCATQHMDPAAQLLHKEKALFDNLEKIGGVLPGNRIEAGQGAIWGYRRKARLGVKLVPKKGGILVGFRERYSSFVTSLQYCRTLDPRISRLLPGLHGLVSGLSNNHRIPQLEVAAGDNGVDIVVRHLEPLTGDDRISIADYARQEDIRTYSQSGGLDTVTPIWPEQPESLFYRLPDFDLKIEFDATDFIQVNADANRQLLNTGLRMLDPGPGDRVADLFCGLGNFTLAIARRAAQVTGIEGDPELVEKGWRNAALNGIDNARFSRFDLHSEMVGNVSLVSDCNKMLLDPPRSGAREVVSFLVPRCQPEVVVYVSCNPATLSRDAQIMVEQNGYRFTHAGVIDMFPHTAHVESIGVFTRE